MVFSLSLIIGKSPTIFTVVLHPPDFTLTLPNQCSSAESKLTIHRETMDKDVEFNQGKNIVEAAKEQGVKHLVWSGLPNATKVSGGELTLIEHFDSESLRSQFRDEFQLT